MRQFNLEEYLKNPSRKIVTRDGRNVTIHCTNCQGSFPIAAEIEGMNFSIGFTNEGKYNYVDSSIYDLFFAPEKHEGWVNLYKCENSTKCYTSSYPYDSEESAIESGRRSNTYIKTIKIEWEE